MTPQASVNLDPPRFEAKPAMLLAGLSQRFHMSGSGGIPSVWTKFAPYLGAIANAVPDVAFGAVYNTDDSGNFDYMACVEVKTFDDAPGELARLRVAAQRYAIFVHTGHISGIQATCQAIWGTWLPQSGFEPADAPFLERYDARFDPTSGNGEVELWLALKT